MEILLIDDQPRLAQMIVQLLQEMGHSVRYLASGEETLALPAEQLEHYQLAMIDMMMPGMDGCTLGIELKKRLPPLITIMLTADARLETVIRALRDSKFDDYLCKSDVAKESLGQSFKLQESLIRAQNMLAARNEWKSTQKALENLDQLHQLVRKSQISPARTMMGQSASFKRIQALVDKVAPTNTTVLIRGETGTGKEVIAREIHRKSHRVHAPFVAINCAAIPRDLLESELFGHKKGAFTGAVGEREGYFKLAHQGTLFLDEIGDMPLDLQAKLLRVLQEKEILPIGGSKPIPVDVRIISATHQDLTKKSTEGLFREDLFYRLNVFSIHVPPLRERPEDIEFLLTHFFIQSAHDPHLLGIAPETLLSLSQYPWKGNVREIENRLERAMLVGTPPYLKMADFFEEDPTQILKSTEQIDLAAQHNSKLNASSQFTPQTASEENWEVLWEVFVKGNCRLWSFMNHDKITQELSQIYQNSQYLTKGRSSRIVSVQTAHLTITGQYLDVHSLLYQPLQIDFSFSSVELEKEKANGEKLHPPLETENRGILKLQQPVQKGLPDGYIFDLLYNSRKRNRAHLFSAGQVIRALILRYALTLAKDCSLKEIFQQVMDFITTSQVQTCLAGLNHDGLEATRARLSSSSHLFFSVGSELRHAPQKIVHEIQQVFPLFKL